MAQLNIEREKIIEKLQRDHKCSRKDAEVIVNRMDKFHSDMIPLVDAWYEGEFKDYTFQTMSVSLFMEIHKSGYLDAITWMDYMLKHPESVALFHKKRFARR